MNTHIACTNQGIAVAETRKRSDAGLTIAEILITLLVLSVGLVLITSALPVALKNTAATDESAYAQIIASNYISVLRALPCNATSSNLADGVKTAFFSAGYTFASGTTPTITQVVPSLLYEPDNSSYDSLSSFRDATFPSGNFFVYISYAPTISAPNARAYNVSVRREGGVWISFPFIRCEY